MNKTYKIEKDVIQKELQRTSKIGTDEKVS